MIRVAASAPDPADSQSAKTDGSGPTLARRPRRRSSLLARGEPFLWTTSGALVVSVVMILLLVGWIAYQGFATFWPSEVVLVETTAGPRMGQVTQVETFRPVADDGTPGTEQRRRLFRTANFRLTNTHFEWIADADVVAGSETRPAWALMLEREEWGRFFGFLDAYVELQASPIEGELTLEQARRLRASVEQAERSGIERGDFEVQFSVRRRVDGTRQRIMTSELADGDWIEGVGKVWRGTERAWAAFRRNHESQRELHEEVLELEEYDIGRTNAIEEAARLELKQAVLDFEPPTIWVNTYLARLLLGSGKDVDGERPSLDAAEQAAEYDRLTTRLDTIERELGRPPAPFMAVVRATEAAQADARRQAASINAEIDQRREAMERHRLEMRTAEGRVTYVTTADVVRAIRSNQLGVGDKLALYGSRWGEFLFDDPREANSEGGVWPAIYGTILMTLIMCLLVVPFGVLAALYLREYAKAGPVISMIRIAVNNLAGVPSIVFGVFGLGFFCYGIGGTIDSWFFEARAPQPTFGKSGLIWASLTLALMTAPVVIVATEEALSAVPNSMREGSYACGASKWQTIRRIVLPRALPGIMTGAILAMARGAGEVAPLMLVGAVKLAPELPLDLTDPRATVDTMFGIQRSFMHLGFHIYDLGFQSQNSKAAIPLVYTTTLLLLGIIVTLNVVAIGLRRRLRHKFVRSAF